MATQKTQAKPVVRTTRTIAAKKTVRKPAGKATTAARAKPAVKPVSKPAARTPAKAVAPAMKKPLGAMTKTTAKTTAKAVAKPVAKLTPKPVTRPAAKAVAKTEKKAELKIRKIKQVRDSFTMPETEYEVLSQVKKACLKAGFEIKKSDLLRIGVSLIKNVDTGKLKTLLAGLTPLKVGRPKK